MDFVDQASTTATPAMVAWDAPAESGGICVDWLNKKKCFGDKVVKSCTVGDGASACMSLGTLVRMQVDFTDDTTTYIVVKKESENAMANKFAASVNCYGTECVFYRDFATKCTHAKVPRCFYASVAPTKEATTLLLEDLTRSSGLGSGSVVPGDTHTSLTLMQLQAAVIELGRFHGSFFNNMQTQNPMLNKLKSAAQHAGGGMFKGDVLLPLFLENWKGLLDEFESDGEEPQGGAAPAASAAPAAGKTSAAAPPPKNKVRAVFEHIAQFHDNWVALLGMGLGGMSIVHGDYKATNLMFQPKSSVASAADTAVASNSRGSHSGSSSATQQATILDFQTIYLGGDVARADDLNYLIVGSVDQNTRLAHEDAMIRFYLEAFSGALREEHRSAHVPEFAEFKHYYKMATQGILYRCMQFNAMLRGAPEEVRKAQLHTLVSRSCDAVVDHSMFEVLAVGRK